MLKVGRSFQEGSFGESVKVLSVKLELLAYT